MRRLLGLLLVLSGCGVPANGAVTVFAAASLTEAFTRIAAESGLNVRFNFAGSAALAAQIDQGAPADVFASATRITIDGVAPVAFAKNQLVIAVAKGNPKGLNELSDLMRPDVKVALCAQQVPCGAAAKKALASVAVQPVTLEQDVKAALSKLKLGEVDAAVVYRTDVRASPDVEGIEFPESADAINEYQIAVLKESPNRAGAQAFVDYVRSEKGMAALVAAGFQR
ncbi:molybdate ABC transporter substrate-binding protein [Allorhizocola rhizosphaerae]|uniref:molybdate ABC transporter substrate-binding protein n=1 Tax=Allorhizocola rhizosphaerae TaxID=1872709 RepID=UPI000E3CBCC9|nr:molybdate ABC transporter substrate-binding protein [Allorhizocola rhizosphaerae]